MRCLTPLAPSRRRQHIVEQKVGKNIVICLGGTGNHFKEETSVTRAGRGKRRASAARAGARTPIERRAAMRWAQRLKRVFGIDVEACAACGGTMRIIACIEDPVVIKAILAHLAGKARPVHATRRPPGRAPPASAFS